MSRCTGRRSNRSAVALTPVVVLATSMVGDSACTSMVSLTVATSSVVLMLTVRSMPTMTSDCSIVLKPASSTRRV